MLIRSVVRIAFRKHRNDLEFLRRQNEKLSHWLKEAQQKIKTREKYRKSKRRIVRNQWERKEKMEIES
jgi:hypothetical protein